MSDRDELIALNLASHQFTTVDDAEGETYHGIAVRTNEDAADILLASDWLAAHDRDTQAEALEAFADSFEPVEIGTWGEHTASVARARATKLRKGPQS